MLHTIFLFNYRMYSWLMGKQEIKTVNNSFQKPKYRFRKINKDLFIYYGGIINGK